GGVLVAVGSPGTAIAIDAVSFIASAALLICVRISAQDDIVRPEPFITELRQGWDEFRKRTWLWSTEAVYGLSNFVSMWFVVLAPVVMKQHYRGAVSYGELLGAFGLGTILGGL